MEGRLPFGVAPRVQLQLSVMNQVGGEFTYVHHLGAARLLKARTRHRRNRHLQEVGRPVHRVHVLVQHAPHVAALAAQDPLHAQPPRLVIDLAFSLFINSCELNSPKLPPSLA